MSNGEAQTRATTLVDEARQCLQTRDLSRASQLAKQAVSLDSTSDTVRSLVTEIQRLENTPQVYQLLKSYIDTATQRDGRQALSYMQQGSPIADPDIPLIAHVLFDRYTKLPLPKDPLLDGLTGAYLAKYVGARRQFRDRFVDRRQATMLFGSLFNRGKHSFDALAPVLMDESTWTSADEQRDVVRDAFQLTQAKLIDSGLDPEDIEAVMSLFSRLLSTRPKDLQGLIDDDAVEIISRYLDINQPQSVRTQATLSLAKMLNEMGDEGGQAFIKFITAEVAKRYNDHLIIAFSATAAAFQIAQTVASELFLTPKFLPALVQTMQRNALGQRKSSTLEKSALELMSQACIDKQCRQAIQKHCNDWLEDVTFQSEDQECQSLAALIQTKVSQEAHYASRLSASLAALVLTAESPSAHQSAIEGLAYTSLQPSVKESLSANLPLLKSLLESLRQSAVASPLTFGILTLFANITTYAPVLSEEQKKMTQLKAYANTQKPMEENPLDDDEHVSRRCKKVLDAGIVSALVASAKSASPTSLGLSLSILRSLAKEQKHRGTMAQQGAVRMLLQSLDLIARNEGAIAVVANAPQTPTLPPASVAAHALARILISVNPSLVFSSSLPASSTIRPLLVLVKPDSEAETRDLLPVFEALLALTNLASMDDDAAPRDSIIRTGWADLENLLLNSNSLVQRAATELVCNLMAAPTAAAKFADGSPAARQRMQVLLALADVRDLKTRQAAGGALAMLTEWDAAVLAVMERERGVKILLDMCADEDESMKHRGLVCIMNVISAPGEAGEKGFHRVKVENGVEILKNALRSSRNPEVLQIGVEALKKLVQ